MQMGRRDQGDTEPFPSRSGATRPPFPCQNEADGTESAPLIGRTVADVERELILETLKHCGGNRTHAANILGISIRTLRNRLHEYASGGTAIPEAHRPGR
jgi:DNA-binding NtrC family response regulator